MRAPAEKDLALRGGKKAIQGFEGKGKPKIGTDEFLELCDAWGYSPATRERIRRVVEKESAHSAWLARYYGPKKPAKVDELEAFARKLFGVRYALAVNSGTSALTAAYVACGIGPGDEVIVPGFTFYATASQVVTAKAIPVVAEVDDSLTLDPHDVERKITPRTKAIVPVNMAGLCCDLDPLMAIARKHKLFVIEDNAQACGGTYKGRLLGTLGHIGCFSVSSFKITGGGEGGLLLTNDEWLHTRATSFHDSSGCWRPDRYARERQPGELFCGENYRMSELEGAVILAQLRKTRAQARRFNTNMRRVLAGVRDFKRVVPRRSNDLKGDIGNNLIFLAEDEALADKLSDALRAEGVGAWARGTRGGRDWHYYQYWEQILERKSATPEGCPFTCPYYVGDAPARYAPDMCPRTISLTNRALFIGINQWWTARDCRQVAAAINKVFSVLAS
ncbi:MAG TPA: aminotransferase class I/II-fold pyridoxal phosphate-dependent enzyme [Planctomycetota bacterium]|nr:aminotransferase class I/II-fold pyridoxal phosphate-dependent enzyme [Planctomycetota bacterium]